MCRPPIPKSPPSPAVIHHANGAHEAAKSCCPRGRSKHDAHPKHALFTTPTVTATCDAPCAPQHTKSRCHFNECKVLQPGLQWRAEQSAPRVEAADPDLIASPSSARLSPALVLEQASAMGAVKIPTPLPLSKSRKLTKQELKEGVLDISIPSAAHDTA